MKTALRKIAPSSKNYLLLAASTLAVFRFPLYLIFADKAVFIGIHMFEHGVVMRGPAEIPSRLDALKLYTLGSAWFSFDEDKRGSLEVGKLADLAVLSDDYLTVPVEKIGSLESVLTMVGGTIVYSSGPFAGLDKKP